MKKLLKAVCVLVLALLLVSCSSSEQKHSHTYYTYFDTVCTITSYQKETDREFETNCLKVKDLLENLNKELDIYHEYAGVNNLCTLNMNASQFVQLSDSTVSFLKYCIDAYDFTNGYTDISMGSVLSLWHTARTETKIVPSYDDLSRASQHTGIDLLEFDGNNVRIKDENALIDTGAIAKGWAAEQVADLLKSLGCTSYVVDLGGNIRFIGAKPNGDSFTVGIRNPSLDGTLSTRLSLKDSSCVTSGDYERYFTYEGVNYCHIIDKNTLYPATNFASVSVVTQNSAKADALSTALFCMDFDSGLKLVQSMSDVRAIWIYKDGTLVDSANLSFK